MSTSVSRAIQQPDSNYATLACLVLETGIPLKLEFSRGRCGKIPSDGVLGVSCHPSGVLQDQALVLRQEGGDDVWKLFGHRASFTQHPDPLPHADREGSMLDAWTWKGLGAPWTLKAPHGVWIVSELWPGGRAELRYAPFNEEGSLPVTPMAVGEFASAGGARLAAEAYEAEEPPELRDELADAFLSGGEAEIQAASGQAFLLSLTDKAVTLSRIEGSALTEWARLDQPRTSGEGPEYMRPPRCEAPAELDLAIMLKIVTLASTQ